MTEFTIEQRQRLENYLATHHVPAGLGTKEEACSIAAINLAIDGRLTDKVPECMSEVIGYWIIAVQDSMPDELRNSLEWKRLLPLAAGSGRDREAECARIVEEWMWTCFLRFHPRANSLGFGVVWRKMCESKDYMSCCDVAENAVVRRTSSPARSAAGYAAFLCQHPRFLIEKKTGQLAVDAVNFLIVALVYSLPFEERECFITSFWNEFNPCKVLEELIAV